MTFQYKVQDIAFKIKKIKTNIDESINNFLNFLLRSSDENNLVYKRHRAMDIKDELMCFQYLKCIFKVTK